LSNAYKLLSATNLEEEKERYSGLTMQNNLVIVGRKPVFRYITACITLFNRGADEVILRARGRSISNCVETVEKLRQSFLPDIKINSISIWSEEFTVEGKRRQISYMEIRISKTVNK